MKNYAMKITKTIEEMGNMIFDLPEPIDFLMFFVYLLLTPIWLPIYIVAKFIEIFKKCNK